VRKLLSVYLPTFVKPLGVSRFFGSDRMRPRITKAKSSGGLLGDEFSGRFNNGAKWITQLAGMFPVGMVNAPELLAGLQSRVRFHGDSSPQIAGVKMYLIHKMRGQSGRCPPGGRGKVPPLPPM
jgi:hypothetical protein